MDSAVHPQISGGFAGWTLQGIEKPRMELDRGKENWVMEIGQSGGYRREPSIGHRPPDGEGNREGVKEEKAFAGGERICLKPSKWAMRNRGDR